MFGPPEGSRPGGRKKGSVERDEPGGGRRVQDHRHQDQSHPGGGYGQRRPGSQGRGRGPARDTIRWRCHFRNTIYEVFKSKKGWKEMPRDEDGGYTDSMDWDICWSDRTWVAQVRARPPLPSPVTPARSICSRGLPALRTSTGCGWRSGSGSTTTAIITS
eukprot:COSAG04_NODE_74_length_28941_cov_11.557971_9_plen_160_part_00